MKIEFEAEITKPSSSTENPSFYRPDPKDIPLEVLNGKLSPEEQEAIQRYERVNIESELMGVIENALDVKIEKKALEILERNPSATFADFEREVGPLIAYRENFRVLNYHRRAAVMEYYVGNNPPHGLDANAPGFTVKRAINAILVGT